MHYRVLGRTGIRVSEIGFGGAWAIGTDMYGGAHDRERDIALIRTALDLGINTFDTADMYGEGLSEKILGKVLRVMTLMYSRRLVMRSVGWLMVVTCRTSALTT